MEAEILQLKADIYNLKDVYRKYSMYGKFLAAISPEDWRKEQVGKIIFDKYQLSKILSRRPLLLRRSPPSPQIFRYPNKH